MLDIRGSTPCGNRPNIESVLVQGTCYIYISHVTLFSLLEIIYIYLYMCVGLFFIDLVFIAISIYIVTKTCRELKAF